MSVHESADSTLIGRFGALFRRDNRTIKVSTHHVGEIRAEKLVQLQASGMVAGNIFASEVTIAGLVVGSIVAEELVVHRGGQIWGNVFALHCRIEEGGRVHGWLNTIENATLISLLNEEISLAELGSGHNFGEVLAGIEDKSLLAAMQSENRDSQGQSAVLRLLQTTTADALIARMNLEQNFTDRIRERIEEQIAELTTLRHEAGRLRKESQTYKRDLDDVTAQLENRETALAEKTGEASRLQKTLSERETRLGHLEQERQQSVAEIRHLTEENGRLSLELSHAHQEIDLLTQRIENLEGAMSASLQRTAEQQESLVRWQELAEVTEQRAKKLDEEVASLRMRLVENAQVVELYRGQKEKIERAWQDKAAELREVEQESALARAELAAAQHTLATQTVELDRAHAQLEQIRNDQALLQAELTAIPQSVEEAQTRLDLASNRMITLESELSMAHQDNQELQDQILWFKASLKASRLELEETRQKVTRQTKSAQQLQAMVEEQRGQAEKWKTTVSQTVALMHTNELRMKQLQQETEAAQQAAAALVERTIQESQETVDRIEKSAAAHVQQTQAEVAETMSANQNQIRQQQARLEASEHEINKYLEEVDRQRKTLAEARAELIERDVELMRLRDASGKQSDELKKVRQLAAAQIRHLQKELTSATQQLADLKKLLDRRQKRDTTES
ncbi:MAG: polymer-forming cytoskeletal protein [Chloroflexi bacterium]|nr:polymer-forming cytoskeletal protein [Chloroflexota bacterium]